MNKYLILDDGDNIKAYDKELDKYVKIGTLPLTCEMFEKHGNDKIYNRNGITLENPVVYMLSDEEKDFKLITKVLNEPQMIKIKSSQTVKGIKDINVEYDISGDSNIKFAISIDNGETYKTFTNEKMWSEINISQADTFISKGIDVSHIATITQEDYEKLFKDTCLFKFAFVLNKVQSEDLCRLKRLKINYKI